MTVERAVGTWPRGASAHGPRTKKKLRRQQKRDLERREEEKLGMFAPERKDADR